MMVALEYVGKLQGLAVNVSQEARGFIIGLYAGWRRSTGAAVLQSGHTKRLVYNKKKTRERFVIIAYCNERWRELAQSSVFWPKAS